MSKPNGLITTATDVSVREKITIQKSLNLSRKIIISICENYHCKTMGEGLGFEGKRNIFYVF